LQVIVSVHKLSRQPYRVKLFSDARRFNIEQRCLQALPDEGSLVFVDAMCTVRPASVLLLVCFWSLYAFLGSFCMKLIF
jgi:hypothetical protein